MRTVEVGHVTNDEVSVKTLFAPGCGLMLYKPHLAERLLAVVRERVGPADMWLTCCRHVPLLPPGTSVVNTCPGCDRRYRENYRDSSTISVWEVLAGAPGLSLPDYAGREMAILDACPTRSETRVHTAVRELIRRMNISLVEPLRTGTESTCCGDSFWGEIPTERVVDLMKKRASEMPSHEVVVYCISCAKSMFHGARQPRYLVDLLFGEDTVPGTCDPDLWHRELQEYIDGHA